MTRLFERIQRSFLWSWFCYLLHCSVLPPSNAILKFTSRFVGYSTTSFPRNQPNFDSSNVHFSNTMSDYGDLNPSLGSISNTTSQLFTSRSVLTVPKGTLVDQQKLWPVQKQGRWTNPMLRKSYQNTSYEEGSNGIIFSSDFNALRKPSRSRTSRNSMSSETERKNNARTSYYGRGSRKDASQSLYDFRDSSDSKSKSPRGIWINSTAMVSHTPTLTIQYNYLADSSISMIEMWPTVKFKKHVSYLTRWWVRAKKWNLLSDELLELERGHMNSLMQDSSSNAREYESTLHEESKLDWADEQHQSVEDGFDDEIDDEDNEIVAEGDVKNSRWRKDGNRYGVRERTSLPRGFQACLSDFCSFKKARVIVIGDVHGCVTELCDLLRACNYRPGDLVVLLGDLVAKGPSSLKCIRLAMSIGAISVRGNHDQEVIRQAQKFRKELSETQKDGAQFNNTDRRDWRDSNSNEHFKIALQLSAREFDWMSHLPFFIRSDDLASLFVHAGK